MASSLIRILLAVVLPSAALAAQSAVVTVNEASVREMPSADAAVLETLFSGTQIRISNQMKEGWYQTRRSNGSGLGWIHGSEVRPDAIDAKLKNAGIIAADPQDSVRDRHYLVFAGFFDAAYLPSASLAEEKTAFGFSLGAGYRIKTDWTARFRFESIGETGSTALLVEYAALHSKPWKVEFGVGPALSFGSDGSPLGGIARLHGHWYVVNRTSLGFELGYSYFQTGLGTPFAGAGLQFEI